jgi:hypothetical protein
MPSLPYRYTLTGLSSTAGYPVYFPDYMVRPFNIGIGCVTASSSTTFNVEHTFDYTGSSTFISTAATWMINSGISAISCNISGNYAYPVSAIRLNVTAGSSTNTVTLTIIQAG